MGALELDETRRQYEGRFQSDEVFNAALTLWLEFYERCELFDRKVCSKKRDDGVAIPGSVDEHLRCHENAERLRREILDPLEHLVEKDTWILAKKDALRKHTDLVLKGAFDVR